MAPWASDITDYRLITKAKMDFVFEEISKCHLNTINNAKILEDKSLIIVGGLITVSTALMGFLVTQCNFDKSFWNQRWSIILPIIVLLSFFWYSMHTVIKSLYPVKYFPPGNEPQMILTQDQFDQPLDWLMFSQAHNMQERITFNCTLNDQRARALQKALFFSALAPIASIVTCGLMQLLPTILSRVSTLWIGRFS